MGRRFWIAALGALIPLTTLTAITAAPAEAAPASISPTSYNFGAVHVWQTEAKDFTVTVAAGWFVDSVGNTPDTVFHPTLAPACFAPSQTASTKCVVTETFAPDEVDGLGAKASTLTVSVCLIAGGSCVALHASVKGDARIPGTLSPNALDFGSHPAGTPVTDTVTIKPDPGVSLDVVTVYPDTSGGYPPAFRTTAFTPGCVQAGSPCTVTVEYDATDVGVQQDTLTVQFCKPGPDPGEFLCQQVSVPLTGNATAPATLSPTSTSFGTGIHVGKSVTKTVTLKVLGDWHVSSTGTGPAEGGNPFSRDWISDCDGNGPQTCTFSVTYAPTAIGKSTGRFEAVLCAPYVDWWPFLQACTTVGASLTGTSVAPGSSPTSLAMGTVKVGQRASKTLVVKHDPGWQVSAHLASDGGSEFSVGECTSIANKCPLPVNFDSRSIGAAADSIIVTLCKPTATEDLCVDLKPVKVTGTGAAPAKVFPTSLSFGTVELGQSKTLDYKVTTDPGWVVANVHTHTVGPSAYATTYGLCFAGQPCSMHVTFSPAYAGGAAQTGTSTPVVCREDAELCVQLGAVKLTGKGIQ